ncbi:MAG: type II TA system antitoxin MqsA family protein [Pseudomonadota bacterium]
MKCLQCGGQMTTARENFRYDAVGLPVTLHGVEVSRCPECGEYEVAIPRIDELHRAIALPVIRKRARLTSGEIRFLRKYLGWSGVDFARHMGVDVSTVSRWENGQQMIGGQADRLLRLLVARLRPVEEYPLEELDSIEDVEAPPLRIGASVKNDTWRAEAAQA